MNDWNIFEWLRVVALSVLLWLGVVILSRWLWLVLT